MEYRQIHVGVYQWAEPVSTGHGHGVLCIVSAVYRGPLLFDKPPTPSQAPPGSSGIGPLSSL